MHIVLCVGENKEENKKGKTKKVLKEEITSVLDNLSNDELSKIIIAYEPVWSIGTGIIPENSEIYKTVEFIKKIVNDEYKHEVKVLYGGSVNTDNIEMLEKIDNIDGYLIGGASLNPNKLKTIIEKVR